MRLLSTLHSVFLKPIVLISLIRVINLIGLVSLAVSFAHLNSYAHTKGVSIYEKNQIFHPTYASKGIVASQEEVASKVGAEILKQGGNAVDAAVAVGYALSVTLPNAGNLGGGGFMVIWLNKEKKSIVINYREKAPLAAGKDVFLDANGKVIENMSRHSYAATGVPGTVYGLNLALKKYGTKSLATVMAPAIKLARDGIQVTHALHRSLEDNKDLLLTSAATEKIFFKNKQPLATDSLLVQKDLANSLEEISNKGTGAFYSGSIATKLVLDMKNHNGLMTAKDLQSYTAEEMPALMGTYRGKKIITVPPPSSGGTTLIEMLNILENYDFKNIPFQSALYYHILVEAMNTSYIDRNNKLGDPDFVSNPIAELTNKKYALAKYEKINLKAHTTAAELSKRHPHTVTAAAKEKMETTHFAVMDQWGNVVANTYTLNGAYGNGKIAEGTGIFLNNEMDDFTSKIGVPNMFGLIQGEKNSIAPGKRPLSSMTPTIVLDENNEPFLALGAMGGSRIITEVLQMMVAVVDYNRSIATAASLPRIHSQLLPDVVYYEPEINPDSLRILQSMGHKIESTRPFGSVQSIMKIENEFFGSSDPRSEGAGVVGVARVE